MDHVGLVDILARRSGAEVAALDQLAPWLARYGEFQDADDAFSGAVMARNGIPDETRLALRAVSHAFRGWGAKATVTRPLADGDEIVAARPHAPGPPPPRPLPLGHRLPRRGARDPARRRPPDQAHLVQPADRPAARRAAGRRGRRRRPGAAPVAADLPRLARGDPGDGRRAPRPPRARAGVHRARPADRRAHPPARAARAADPQADRRAAAHRASRSRRRCGATSRSPRRTSR